MPTPAIASRSLSAQSSAQPFRTACLLAGFGLSLAGLIALMSLDFRPQPFYANVEPDLNNTAPFPGLADGEPLSIEFEAPAANLNAIYWGNIFTSTRQQIDVSLFNVTQDLSVGVDVIDTTDVVSDFHDGKNRRGDRMRLTMRWRRDLPPWLPLLPAGSESATGGILSIGGKTQDRQVAVYLSEERPSTTGDTVGTIQADSAILEAGDWLELKRNEPVEVEISVPDDGLRVVSVPALVVAPLGKVRIEIHNLTSGQHLGNSLAVAGEPWEKPIPSPRAGDRLLLKLKWDAIPPPMPRHPTQRPAQELVTTSAEGSSSGPPVFIAHYRWSSCHLLWLWLAMPLLLIVAIRRPRFQPYFLIIFALMASGTGMLGWQQQYSGLAGHLDPDSYGAYAEQLAEYVRTEDSARRAAHANWFHEYPNSEVPLTSVVLSILLLLGIPLSPAYLWLVAMCAFGVLLTVRHILQRELGLAPLTCLLAVVALGCHLPMLKSFCKPSPDMPGLLLTTLMFAGILWRFRESSPWQTAWLALLPLLLMLARHGTPAYLPFYAGGILAADVTRQGNFRLGRELRTVIVIIAPGVLIYALAFLRFGWLHNFRLALNTNRSDTEFHGLAELATVLAAVLQFFLLSWLLFPRTWRLRRELRPAIALAGSWIAYFTIFMLAIKASMIQRLFLPIVPAVIILFACGVDELTCRLPRTLTACVLIICTCNVAIAVYAIHLPYLPPVQIARFIF